MTRIGAAAGVEFRSKQVLMGRDISGPVLPAMVANASTFGTWVQSIASTVEAYLLTDIFASIVQPTANTQVDAHIQVGVGGAGSEIPVASFYLYRYPGQTENALTQSENLQLPHGVYMPAGARVAVRARSVNYTNTSGRIVAVTIGFESIANLEVV